jgi:hypothetical protein
MIMHAWKAAFDGRAVAAREAIEAANEMPAEPVGDPTFIRPVVTPPTASSISQTTVARNMRPRRPDLSRSRRGRRA